MQPPDQAPKAFSTVGLSAARRVELWETHNSTALIGLDVQTSEPLVATELNVRFPNVDLARVGGSAHVVRRTRKVIEHSPVDAIAVYLTLRGDAWFECADRTFALRPGNILISETDQPFARGFRRGLEELVVKVDRAALPEVPQLTRPVITSLRAGGPDAQFARTLTEITGRATRTERPPTARREHRTRPDRGARYGTLRHLRDRAPRHSMLLYRRAYDRPQPRCRTSSGGDRDQRAATVPGFRRRQHLYPRHILSRRLDLAYSMLSSAPTTEKAETVANVAARCGFTSVTYFSHAFRQHLGHRASDIRGA